MPPAPKDGGVTDTPPISPGDGQTMPDVARIAQMLPEESRQQFMQMSDEEKQMVVARMMGG